MRSGHALATCKYHYNPIERITLEKGDSAKVNLTWRRAIALFSAAILKSSMSFAQGAIASTSSSAPVSLPLTPGPFTFILKGTKEMPRLVLDPRRKTAGLRIPDHPICRAILARLGGILASTSAKLPDTEEVESLDELFDLFSHRVDLIVDDGGALRNVPSTVIDLATPDFEIVREGLGMEALTPFLK